MEELTDIQKFKKILEYFVAHLTYLAWRDRNDNTDDMPDDVSAATICGFDDYIKPHFENAHKGWRTGSGHLTHREIPQNRAIQDCIKDWCEFEYESQKDYICINVQLGEQGGKKKLYSPSCYLNWCNCDLCQRGDVNIVPVWDNNNEKIISLKTTTNQTVSIEIEDKVFQIAELALYEPGETNTLINLFQDYRSKREMEIKGTFLTQTCIDILEKNYNLILSGAPGTGKTWLAYDIASHLCHNKAYKDLTDKDLTDKEKEQIGFVQFHPSYDYTDFVEGLRPDPDTTTDGNVGFARTDGVFKEFCKRALGYDYENINDPEDIDEVDYEDMFEQAWSKLKEDLTPNKTLDIHLNDKIKFTIQLNVSGKGLADKHDSYTRYYNPGQLLRVYKGLPGVRKGGHDNYRKAIVEYMKTKYKLQDYNVPAVQKNSTSGDKNIEKKKYVFIIDEINRGELSKIFGELFFCIDKGYRGDKHKVFTQYQNLVEDDVFADGFYIPENVYIIGTMNDIDRSVETMDFAMRRRFTFKEILASDRLVMLDDALEDDVKEIAIKTLSVLNKQIEKTLKLSSAYHVGPAYFLDLKKERYDGDFDMLWSYNIKPLLQEYMRGKNGAAEMIAIVHEEYTKVSRSDIED